MVISFLCTTYSYLLFLFIIDIFYFYIVTFLRTTTKMATHLLFIEPNCSEINLPYINTPVIHSNPLQGIDQQEPPLPWVITKCIQHFIPLSILSMQLAWTEGLNVIHHYIECVATCNSSSFPLFFTYLHHEDQCHLPATVSCKNPLPAAMNWEQREQSAWQENKKIKKYFAKLFIYRISLTN